MSEFKDLLSVKDLLQFDYKESTNILGIILEQSQKLLTEYDNKIDVLMERKNIAIIKRINPMMSTEDYKSKLKNYRAVLKEARKEISHIQNAEFPNLLKLIEKIELQRFGPSERVEL